MEVVAALASVAQLTSYAINLIEAILDTHESIKSRPAQLHQRRRQLELLEFTVTSLSRNKTLRTPSIGEYLEVIGSRIECLNGLLKEEAAKRTQGLLKKYCRAWTGDKKLQRIAIIFEDIESNKSALLLSIGETHACISGKIYSTLIEGFSSIQGKMSDPDSSSPRKELYHNSPRTIPEIGSQLNENGRRQRVPSQALYAAKETQQNESEEEERLEASRRCSKPAANTFRSRANDPPPIVSQSGMSQASYTADQPRQPQLRAESGSTFGDITLGEQTAFAVGNWGEKEKAGSEAKHVFGNIKSEKQAGGIIGNVYHVESATKVLLKKHEEANEASGDESRRS